MIRKRIIDYLAFVRSEIKNGLNEEKKNEGYLKGGTSKEDEYNQKK